MKPRVLISLIVISLLIGIMGTAFAPSIVTAASTFWNSCTKVTSYCYYPGRCKDYIDTNGDKICDKSQPNPATSVSLATGSSNTATPVVAAYAAAASVTPTIAGVLTTAPEPVVTRTISNNSNSLNVVLDNDPLAVGDSANSPILKNNSYYLIPILLASALLYLFTWVLTIRKKITLHLHRKIWNTALLVYGLVTILLGLLLTIRIETGFNPSLPFNMLFWHVEAGIAMGFVSVFHIIWHRKYFANLIKIQKPVPLRNETKAHRSELNIPSASEKQG